MMRLTGKVEGLESALKNRSSLWSRITKNFSIGITGALGLMLFRVCETVLLTKNLSVEDFGRIILVINFYQIMDLLLNIRVNDVMFRFIPYFEEHGKREECRAILRLCFLLCTTVAVLVLKPAGRRNTWFSPTRDKPLQ